MSCAESALTPASVTRRANVASAIDELLSEIRSLSDRIARLDDGPERLDLEAQREGLRAEARLLADASRRQDNLEAELAAVEQQLAELEDVAIKPAWQERFRIINDPSAYRRRINESLDANEAAHRDDLERRRSELLAALRAKAQSDE
jgi:hypothetical protein